MTLSSPAIFHVTARKKKSRVRATAVVNKDIKVVTAQTVATTTTRVEVITIERDVDTRICGMWCITMRQRQWKKLTCDDMIWEHLQLTNARHQSNKSRGATKGKQQKQTIRKLRKFSNNN